MTFSCCLTVVSNKGSNSVNSIELAYTLKMSANLLVINPASQNGLASQVVRSMAWSKLILFLCGFVFLVVAVPGNGAAPQGEKGSLSANPLLLSSGQIYSDLSRHLVYGFESDAILTIDNVDNHIVWQSAPEKPDLVLGFGQKATWVKVDLQLPVPSSDEYNPWLLFLPYHALNHLDYYVIQQGQVVAQRHLGSDLSFTSRDVDHRYYVMPLPETGLLTVYLRIEASGVMYVPLRVLEQSQFVEMRESEHFFHGVYAGVIAAMVLYNLFLFLAIRENIYVSYIAYMVSYFMLLMANEGFGFQYLWPTNPGFNVAASPFFAALAGYFSLDFTARFLNLKGYSYLLDVVFNAAKVVCVVLALLALLVNYDFNFIVNLLSICFTFVIIGASI